jgi:hypothetical protein
MTSKLSYFGWGLAFGAALMATAFLIFQNQWLQDLLQSWLAALLNR